MKTSLSALLAYVNAKWGGTRDATDFYPPVSMAGEDCHLARYLSAAGALPIPTMEQMQAFALHVSRAHSWYKHLPYCAPGSPFYFYLDPAAGMERRLTPDGQLIVSDRETKGFHHSGLPTCDYRDRFGHLAFAQGRGTVVAMRAPDGTMLVPADNQPTYFDFEATQQAAVPEAVLKAGTAFLTAVLYPNAAYRGPSGNGPALYQTGVRMIATNPERLHPWPEASGGRATLDAIIASRNDLERLAELLEPERERQLNEIVLACKRVVAMVGRHNAAR